MKESEEFLLQWSLTALVNLLQCNLGSLVVYVRPLLFQNTLHIFGTVLQEVFFYFSGFSVWDSPPPPCPLPTLHIGKNSNTKKNLNATISTNRSRQLFSLFVFHQFTHIYRKENEGNVANYMPT